MAGLGPDIKNTGEASLAARLTGNYKSKRCQATDSYLICQELIKRVWEFARNVALVSDDINVAIVRKKLCIM